MWINHKLQEKQACVLDACEYSRHAYVLRYYLLLSLLWREKWGKGEDFRRSDKVSDGYSPLPTTLDTYEGISLSACQSSRSRLVDGYQFYITPRSHCSFGFSKEFKKVIFFFSPVTYFKTFKIIYLLYQRIGMVLKVN